MSEATTYEVPIPAKLESITAIHDGKMWFRHIIQGSVTAADGVVSFTVRWNGSKKQYTLATEIISGYECDV